MRVKVSRLVEELDENLGKCTITKAFAQSRDEGGVGFQCESGAGYIYEIPIEVVIELARQKNMNVQLAGPEWRSFGLEPGGEVPPDELEKLVSE